MVSECWASLSITSRSHHIILHIRGTGYTSPMYYFPLRTVLSLQSLSSCKVHLYLYSNYGLYGLYRHSVMCSTAIFLLPLGTVHSLHSLSACKISSTSSPPKDRTDCTEPQFICSTAIPLLPLWTVPILQNLSACTVQLYV